MKRRIATSIARAFRASPDRETVHFHVDSGGRPFVCDYHRCESVALTQDEVGFSHR
jgi:hypothetical protein